MKKPNCMKLIYNYKVFIGKERKNIVNDYYHVLIPLEFNVNKFCYFDVNEKRFDKYKNGYKPWVNNLCVYYDKHEIYELKGACNYFDKNFKGIALKENMFYSY